MSAARAMVPSRERTAYEVPLRIGSCQPRTSVGLHVSASAAGASARPARDAYGSAHRGRAKQSADSGRTAWMGIEQTSADAGLDIARSAIRSATSERWQPQAIRGLY